MSGVEGEPAKRHFDLAELPPRDRYRLLTGVVVPRPIAWVTSVGADGHVNAAPFSYFNVLGTDPPIVAIGIGDRSSGDAKDTARNIADTGDFVVNMVDEDNAERMNISSADFAYGGGEVEAAGVTTAPSQVVRAPMIAESPVNMECRAVRTLEIGRTRVIIGEIVVLHVLGDAVDGERLGIHADRLNLIGRMHGTSWYTRTRDLFELHRPRKPEDVGRTPSG